MEPEKKSFREETKLLYRTMLRIFSVFAIFAGFMVYLMVDPDFNAFKSDQTDASYTATTTDQEDWDKIENGIHIRTGLIAGEGLMETVNNCTNCHSAMLVTQNRMSQERWAATIDWMQETQNLWDLGRNEAIIINYLVTNYPVQSKGRRQSLSNIAWYELED